MSHSDAICILPNRFVETALASGSDTALLTTKKLIVDKLNGVLKTRCEVPNPNHVVNIKFMSDKGTPRTDWLYGCMYTFFL